MPQTVEDAFIALLPEASAPGAAGWKYRRCASSTPNRSSRRATSPAALAILPQSIA